VIDLANFPDVVGFIAYDGRIFDGIPWA